MWNEIWLDKFINSMEIKSSCVKIIDFVPKILHLLSASSFFAVQSQRAVGKTGRTE